MDAPLPPTAPTDAQLLAVLARGRPPGGSRITGLRRRPNLYSSSFPQEEVDLALSDGSTLPLMFKNFAPDEGGQSLYVKPAFLRDPCREIEIYRRILGPLQLGTPQLFAAEIDSAQHRHWLFLERVEGLRLAQVGDVRMWRQAARWLARLHAVDHPPVDGVNLVRHDALYATWIARGRAVANRMGQANQKIVHSLLDRYGMVIERLSALPHSLVHSDFYPANILIRKTAGAPIDSICVIDWEVCGVGPSLLDLAALTSGDWSEADRLEMIESYALEMQTRKLGRGIAMEQLLTGLKWCRLHLALQWTAWADDWTPPADQARDWSGELIATARQLGLVG